MEKTAGRSPEVMFAMPQVEVASHTHTHPYFWEFFENYQREREVADVLKFSNQPNSYNDRSLMALANSWRGRFEETETALVELAAGDNETPLPRARPHEPFDLELEVRGSLQAASRLAPKEKPAALYLWSGDTRPFEAALGPRAKQACAT